MGKRIIQQRRGRGSPTYKAKSHKYKAKIVYPDYTYSINEGFVEACLEKLFHCPGHTAPLMQIKLMGKKFYNIAPEGVKEGQKIYMGKGAQIKAGNILPLGEISEGTAVYNLEVRAGDGGRLVRTAGSSARVVKHLEKGGGVIVKLPSKKEKTFDVRARATIGRVAAAGRLEKPIVKAGKKWHMMRAKGKLYPRTSAVCMNVIDHPFGSGRGKRIGTPKTPPKHAPAGRKVGLLRARRTGRKKK